MRSNAVAGILFFLSGCAALILQVNWQRMLGLFSGTDVRSATIVVATFMAGMGLGSLAGGHVADRVGRSGALFGFAAAEFAICAFALVSRALLYNTIYLGFGHVPMGITETSLVLFASLLWPTFFMGASLPLLARGLVRDLPEAASVIGSLYGVNTMGAALGAFAGTWVLMPQVGVVGGIRVAAAMNLTCALVAAALAVSARSQSESSTLTAARGQRSQGDTDRCHDSTWERWSWPALAALAGFATLSLEVVWFRLLGVVLKSTAHTFGTVLAVYLAGIGLGSAIGSWLAPRVRRPGLWFLGLQATVGLYAAATVVLPLLAHGRLLDDSGLSRYFSRYDGVDLSNVLDAWRAGDPGAGRELLQVFRIYLALLVPVVVPPTVLSGISFPMLQHAAQTDLDRLGRRLGALVASNIVGSTLGAAITGVMLLDWLGTPGTLTLMVCVSLVFAVAALFHLESRDRRAPATAVVTAVVVAGLGLMVAMPDAGELWARLHGSDPARAIVREDASGVTALRDDPSEAGRTVVFVNGLGQSKLPYGDIHTVLGALPVFALEEPRRALVIGLGSGDTLFAAAARPGVSALTAVEIVGAQHDALSAFYDRVGYPGLQRVLRDARITHRIADGRRLLAASSDTYDVIEADALRPHSAYSGNLYSDGYFRLLLSHLAPGGLAVSWAPTDRTARTFLSVFPYAAQHEEVLLGSNQPITLDVDALRRRLDERAIRAGFAAAGIDIVQAMTPYLDGSWRLYRPGDPRPAGDRNTDLHPRDELDAALFRLPAPIARWLSSESD